MTVCRRLCASLVLGLTLTFLLLSVVPAHAQPATSYTFKVWNVGAATPISTTSLPAGSFVCNQAAPAGSVNVINPARAWIDDGANVGRVCLFTDTPGGPLLGLPFSTVPLQATIAVTNIAGTSPDSVASNSFTRPGLALPAPTGVRVAP